MKIVLIINNIIKRSINLLEKLYKKLNNRHWFCKILFKINIFND